MDMFSENPYLAGLILWTANPLTFNITSMEILLAFSAEFGKNYK